MATTWNPSDKSAAFTLSSGNLRAAAGGTGNIGVRANAVTAIGKWYFEFTVHANYDNYYDGCGVVLLTQALNNAYAGTGGAILTNNTRIIVNAVDSGVNLTSLVAVNDVISCAVDLDNQRIWYRKNGGVWTTSGGTGNPATNTGGVDISGAGSIAGGVCAPYVASSTNTIDITADFGATSYSYSAPAGFSNWIATALLSHRRAFILG